MKKILCFGDSITNGARDEYMRNYPLELNHIINGNKKKSICINEGINGETTSGMANRSYKIFEKYANFDMLIFYGGTNDSKIPMPMDVYEKNINYIMHFCFIKFVKFFILNKKTNIIHIITEQTVLIGLIIHNLSMIAH